MNFRPREKQAVDVDLTPLIDVVFLLLIFFMVTTTFDRNAEIKVELPTASTTVRSDRSDKLELLIDGQGRYYVNGREVLNSEPETLFQAMTQVLNEMDTVPPLVISADSTVNYQTVVTAMDIAGRLGLTNFSLATTQSERK
ncbi:MAG: biopolymer transporter ExbD [Thiothrix sp.]|nr:biopolymer transporter ExbD [Thiothrix sp.]HPQ95621.1 biopolymer transporter ExbD [Thiolinea sp.]